jgi:Ca-activated chloride channel homolog
LKPGSTVAFAATLFCLALAIGIVAPRTDARPGQTSGSQQQTLEAKTELVKLDVSVLNAKGDFVDGLTQADFRVLDDGAERPITFFAPVSTPAKVVVVLETSPAVYLFKDEHLAAAYSLLGGLGADDEVALVTYADVPRELVSFTTDKMLLFQALGNTQYMMGSASLNLYDAVSDVVDGLSRFSGKKAVILLTTGIDSSSPARWNALTQKLRESDVVIFAVGLLGPLASVSDVKQKDRKKVKGASAFDTADDPEGTLSIAKADNALVSLTAMTGGRAYFPASGDDFSPTYREIASSLRHEYVLGVLPDHDGQFHTLTVSVVNPDTASATKKKKKKKKKNEQDEYRVSAREGYVAPGH